mgnify:FL=1
MQYKMKHKLEDYALTNIDDNAHPYYYGYINSDGQWYIMKQNSDGSILYAVSFVSPRGQYSTNWNNRTILDYSYWDTGF